jgi:hypothetical protein
MHASNTITARTPQTFAYHFPVSRQNSPQLLARLALIPLVCVCLLYPPIVLSDSLPLAKAEQVLLFPIFAAYGWLLMTGYARPFRFNGMFLVGAAFTVTTLLSIWYGASILGQSVIFRDFYEIPKLWLPIVFFTVAYEARLSESSLRNLLNFFGWSLLFVCFYAWCQWAGLPVGFLNNYYCAGQHIDAAFQYARRVYSTMGNPNVLAQLMTWSIAAFMMATLLRVGSRFKAIAIVLACTVTLAMTGSRYGLISTGIASLLVMAAPGSSSRRRMANLGIVLLLILTLGSTVFQVATSNKATQARLETLKNPLQTDSLRERLDTLWLNAGDEFFQSPFLGHGPAKDIFTGIITDSEYLDVLKEFGIIGFIPYLAYYLFPLFLFWKGMKAGQRVGPRLEEQLPATLLTLRLSFVMVVTSLVMNIGMSTFYNFVLQSFIWILLGLGARAAKTIRDVSSLRQLSLFPQQFRS